MREDGEGIIRGTLSLKLTLTMSAGGQWIPGGCDAKLLKSFCKTGGFKPKDVSINNLKLDLIFLSTNKSSEEDFYRLDACAHQASTESLDS